MRNIEIMSYYYKLEKQYVNMKSLPARVSFAIVRNLNIFRVIVHDIEQVKYEILKRYGDLDRKTFDKFKIREENIEIANKELEELGNTDTKVDIMKIKLSDIQDLQFTPDEIETLMFMIEEG